MMSQADIVMTKGPELGCEYSRLRPRYTYLFSPQPLSLQRYIVYFEEAMHDVP